MKVVIPEITYREILTMLKNYIITNCVNIGTRYDSFDSDYKNATNIKVAYVKSSKGTGCADHYFNITNGIVKKTETDVDNDIKSFFDSVGLPEAIWDTLIDDYNLYLFLYNISVFCSFKICWACAQLDSFGTITGTSSAKTTSATNKYTVYSNNVINGGKNMYVQQGSLADVTNPEIVANKIVIGSVFKDTINTTTLRDIVNSIMDNRLSRKIIPIKYTASITVL